MTDIHFALILLLLGLTYGFKDLIAEFINEKVFEDHIDFKIESKFISYLLFAAAIFALIFGMLVGSTTKEKFGHVDTGIQHLNKKDRPHPWFDIDTYW